MLLAVATAAASSDPSYALSRVFYLLLFGWFAFGLATALRAGRLSTQAVAKSMVYSGALAAIALIIQFAAQFGAGQDSVISWLRGVQSTFAGQRAAGISTINWVIDNPHVLRGIFPFMDTASAGQYMMLC